VKLEDNPALAGITHGLPPQVRAAPAPSGRQAA
jgi:hypothetical protein